MSSIRKLVVVLLALGLSACAAPETATRNAPRAGGEALTKPLSVDVQQIRVIVPETLIVSEANLYYPGGDIVWREDPPGNRHEQVRAIVEAAAVRGVGEVERGDIPVDLDIQVTRFHALSQKARYTVGGVHALQFAMTFRNPETGLAVGPPRQVKADFKALGGAEALTAERLGITQKVRITDHLAEVIKIQLTDPGSFKPARLGLLGAINQM